MAIQPDNCAEDSFVSGFCLADGTPILIVFDDGTQIGWINVTTGVFTAGPAPVGTMVCDQNVTVDLDVNCDTDSITVCPPVSGFHVIVDGTVTTPATYAEDSGHVSGNIGDFILVVRNDAGTSLVNADLDYAPLQVDSTGALRTSTAPIVIAQSVVSAPNSTATPLAGGATFTGTFVDCLEFADVTITLATSHNSATDGLKVEWSTDGINVDADDVFTITGSAGPGKQYTFGVSTRFVRVRYVNGGTPQTFFRLQTILKRVRGKPSSHRIAETITLQDDAELVKAVIAGETTAGGGSTVNVKVNPSGTLEVNASQETSPWVVSGTDFDIRNLDCLTDSVTICGTVEVTGAVSVAFDYPEDSLHVSGDIGAFVLAVRNDANVVLTSTDGDYSPIAVDADGAVQISDGGNSITTDNPDIPDLTGTWAYEAGVAGTEIIGAGRRVIGIAAHAGVVAGSMTINGGDVIPVPANSSITINPYGQLVAPTIVFTGTDSYFIETLI